ncbi:unnamed protein product [Rodentolepis nana]|uniref:DUF3677 domain-containing protein n=1 Tax=Rodentolepis nana TaxID=102285 RepID=A0A0R3T5W5_RODNA|nr:unnamed protein product [Rodentolepis nana]
MRGSKKNYILHKYALNKYNSCLFIVDLQPATGFIPLSFNRSKRPSEIQHSGPSLKKSRHELHEVGSSELVSRVETLLGSGNVAEAEALVVSVLHHIRDKATSASSIPGISGASLSRPGGVSTSRLPPAYTIGLLVIAKHPSGPSLLSRPAVLEQLYSLLTLSIGKSRINVSPAGNISSKSRNINAFAANLLWIALKNLPKWPVKLLKLYLEDSISDRAWVDLDECKALVLNIETAFPAVQGDPRGLLQILSTDKTPPGLLSALRIPSSSSLSPGTSQQQQQQQQQSSFVPASAFSMSIAEAVAVANTTLRLSQTAKLIYGEDPAKLISPRYESNRSIVENLIVATLRDNLSRRSPAVTGGLSHAGDVAMGSSASNDHFQIRSLLRTIGLAAGIPEVRSLAAQKLEVWFANPKLQVLAAGFFAILTLNCNQSTNSLFDIDFMVTVIFRVRQKLFKNTIQASYLDNICRMVEANPNNLDALIKICLASELPTLSAICESFDLLAKLASKQQQPNLPSSVVSSASNTANQPQARCVAEIVRKLAPTPRGSESGSYSDSLNNVVQNSIESFGKGQSTVYALLPRLLQHYPEKWTVVLGEVLHDRIIEAVANPNSLSSQIAGPLPPSPSEDELINHIIFLLKPMRKFLRDLTNWIRAAAALPSSVATPPTGSNSSIMTDFLPCAEIGCVLLGADRERNPPMQESAEAVVHRMWELSGGQNFGPVTLLRYAYGVTHIICQLQMISITRALSNDTPVLKKKAEGNTDPIKVHHTCIRQIRSYYLRWFRNFLPALFSSISNNAPLSEVLGPAVHYVHKCFSRASFLEVTSFFDASSSTSTRTAVFPPFYAAEDVWSTEKSQRQVDVFPVFSTQVCHLTCMPLWEKHAINLLRYGVDLQRVLLDPMDAVSIVCELIWRGTAFACENNSESMNFTKLDDLINLLFKCCYYRSDPDFPSEFADLAHRAYYWKVTMALVALAIHSPSTCGTYFWINFPTVRKLMEMVITNDFTSDGTSVESEYLNMEMENQLIGRLETYLSEEAATEVNGRTAVRFSLAGKLVRCNPRGACRRPPDEELATLKQLSSRLKLRRRLCSCRQPDFLLELILSQSTDLPQPWVIHLVESLCQDFTTLPLQCLADYILHAAIKRIRSAEEKDFTAGTLLEDKFDVPSITDRQPVEGPRRNRLDSTGSTRSNTEKSASLDDMEMRFLHIMHHLQEQAQSPVPDLAAIATQLGPEAATAQQLLLDSVVEAILQSFASRLRDSSSLIRRAARYCLTLLVSKDLPVACSKMSIMAVSNQSTEEFLLVLQSLLSLPGLSVALSSTSQQQPQGSLEFIPGSRGMHFLDLILNAILVEDEIAPLTAYIHFLGQLTEIGSFEVSISTITAFSNALVPIIYYFDNKK